MRISISGIVIIMLLQFAGCAAQKQSGVALPDVRPLAFPGAEGFGKYTSGGREGKIFIVTTLADRGKGSFREAATAKEKRIIVFAVSGTIHLESKLSIAGNCTIAGQTAPGDGICIADQPVVLGGNNIIVRFLRFRMGDRLQSREMVHGSGGDDAFGGLHRSHIMIDHCSISWSTDEAFSVYAGDSTTLQWNLVSEPLNYSFHFETGDKDFENHGFGGIWGGRHLTAHHNLFAHCYNRTPRFDGIRNIPEENADFRNNVLYNWGTNNVYAGEGGTYNIVNNYYKYGPSTRTNVKFQVVNPFKKAPAIPFGKFYIHGNYVDSSTAISSDNWLGVKMNDGTEEDKTQSRLARPFAAVSITTQTAEEAYATVLDKVGAILPVRDTLDQRIINDVRNRTGRIIDVQGGFPHGTSYELSKIAWPKLRDSSVLTDTDKDGMPDEWENKNGLNPGNPDDNKGYNLSPSFTNIEEYLNSLVKI